MLPNIGHYTFTYFAWVNLLTILKSLKDKCNRESCCINSRSKEKCYFILYLFCNHESCCINSHSKDKCYFMLYLFCNRKSCCINSHSIRARHCTDGKIQRLLARPPNSKLIINICFISGPKAAKLPKFLYSKFPNCVYHVFSAPRTLIAIFCLFSCVLLVIQSHTGIGSAAWGACTGPFFSVVMFCWVHAHTCSCPQLKK